MPGSSNFEHWKRAVYPRYWSRTSREYGIDAYVSGLLELVRSLHPAELFELAIGTGYPFAAELTKGGVGVTGCDISELLVDECACSAPAAKAFVGGYGDEATLRKIGDRRFDVVYCFRSTWYFPDLDQAIEFMVQLAKPGGHVIFDIMNSDARWNQELVARKRRLFPLTIAKNVVKAVANVVRPGNYMLDQVFGHRDIMYAPSYVEDLLRRQALRFERLTRGEIERGRGASPTGEDDQKLVYVVQR